MNDSPADCQSRPRPACRRGIPSLRPRRRGLHLFAMTFFVSQKTRRSPFRRSSSSEKRPFPPPRGFRSAGGVLFLFSPIARFARKRSRSRSRAFYSLARFARPPQFIIPHCPFPSAAPYPTAPRPPCERGSEPPAACGGGRKASEWPRSNFSSERCERRKRRAPQQELSAQRTGGLSSLPRCAKAPLCKGGCHRR